MINKWMGIAENASEHGLMIDHMLEVVHLFMLVLFVGWTAFFFYTLYRFHRKRHPKAIHDGTTSHFSTHAEVGVVIVEAILLLGLAFPLWANRVNEFPDADENPVNVRVIGYQFGWAMHYPGPDGAFGPQNPDLIDAQNFIGLDRSVEGARDDIVVLNVLRLPANRPAVIQLSSLDVIHNFACYTMRASQDAIPGSEIPMWFTPVRTGEYEVICGQLCGDGHARMKATLIVESPQDYEQWIERMSAAAQG